MAVTFFPFNSIVVGGVADRPANAENLAAYLAGFFSNGVLMQQDTSLQVSVSSGMNVQIHAGVGNINGKTILNTAAEIVPIEAASLSLDRIDRVIFRLDEVNRLMEFDVLKGTAASSPTAPALTQGADIYEMCLAEVRVPAGASSIIASYITDTRADSALCGYSSIPGHMQDIAYGGTGANTAAGALANLGIDPIKAGDTVSLAWNGATYLTSSSKTISLSIPLRRPILAESVACTSNSVTTRQAGNYTHGSSGTAGVSWTVDSCEIREHGIHVSLTRTTTTNAVNNDTIGVNASLTFKFS